jgi:hypothetical protein
VWSAKGGVPLLSLERSAFQQSCSRKDLARTAIPSKHNSAAAGDIIAELQGSFW